MNSELDRSSTAGEYVLGTLDRQEREAAAELVRADPDFARLVRDWESRLGELHVMVGAVPPPQSVWDALVASLDGPATPSAAPAVDEPQVVEPAAIEDAVVAPPSIQPTDAASPPLDPVAMADERPDLATPDATAPVAVLEPLPAATEPPSAIAPVESAPVEIVPAEIAPAVIAAPMSSESAPVAPASDAAPSASRWRRLAITFAAVSVALAGVVATGLVAPDLLPESLRPEPREVIRTVEVLVPTDPAPAPQLVAPLAPTDAAPAFLLTLDAEERRVTVRRIAAVQEEGKSYELWLISDRLASPRSLGIVGAQEFTELGAVAYDPDLLAAASFGITREAEGGSPSGEPSGAMLFIGKPLETLPAAPLP